MFYGVVGRMIGWSGGGLELRWSVQFSVSEHIVSVVVRRLNCPNTPWYSYFHALEILQWSDWLASFVVRPCVYLPCFHPEWAPLSCQQTQPRTEILKVSSNPAGSRPGRRSSSIDATAHSPFLTASKEVAYCFGTWSLYLKVSPPSYKL